MHSLSRKSKLGVELVGSLRCMRVALPTALAPGPSTPSWPKSLQNTSPKHSILICVCGLFVAKPRRVFVIIAINQLLLNNLLRIYPQPHLTLPLCLAFNLQPSRMAPLLELLDLGSFVSC